MHKKPVLGRPEPPYRVFATWNIHYACNYSCTYCHAPKPGRPDVRTAAYIPSLQWIDIWKKYFEMYGTWEILVSGGEPFSYPGFMELIIEVAKIHYIGVCTNLEWDVERFVAEVSPERVKIETSYHPEFAKLDIFVKRLELLKKKGFEPVTVNFVPWPPLLGKMAELKSAVDGAGCQLTLQPFIGRYEGREYPQGYTAEERKHFDIFDDDCNLKTLDFKTTKAADSTAGKLCRMGQNYAFIHPDGTASRCCRDHTVNLGSLIDGTFRLLDGPLPCVALNCNCWRCMLLGKEDFWMRHWGRHEVSKEALERFAKNA